MTTILKSTQDASVNFVEKQLEGFLESRYVTRGANRFNCYLSSQTGCNRGCKFCHLTASGQTLFRDATKEDFLDQAKHVFEHYKQEPREAGYIHFSFMARGEPLANRFLLKDADDILWGLGKMALDNGLGAKFNLSTILPKSLSTQLTDVFRVIHPTIY